LPLEESNWLGPLAIDLAASYRLGASRGDRSMLGTLGVSEDMVLAAFGRAINDLVLTNREAMLAHCLRIARERPEEACDEIKLCREAIDQKVRWVDGTPEYSFYICELRKLFPEAKFLHILRDVEDVVRSLLEFRPAGVPLVHSPEEAYDYWLRTVQSCLVAEQALGPAIVRRVNYADLVDSPEACLKSVLSFIDADFEEACVLPLKKRINSSFGRSVSPGRSVPAPEAPNQAEARQLYRRLTATNAQPHQGAPILWNEMVRRFERRVEERRNLEPDLQKARKLLDDRQKELDERTTWAFELDSRCQELGELICGLSAQVEERTAWAIRQDAETQRLKEVITRSQIEFHEKVAWAANLKNQCDAQEVLVKKLITECEERTCWALTLENDLRECRKELEQRDQEIESRTRWAGDQDKEIERLRKLVTARQEVS
jgi:hypothetical protein